MDAKLSSPVFSKAVKKEWFDRARDADVVHTAQATDLAFNMLRNKAGLKSGWTEFNQSLSKNDQDVTAIGYMPILQAPAHELDT